MEKQFVEKNSDFLFSAAIVLFFATLSALALYAVTTIDQPDLFL